MDRQSLDRREYVRLPKAYPVELRRFAFPLDDQPFLELRCVDVSAGGLRISGPLDLAKGDKLTVTIRIPSLNKFHPGFWKVFESDMGQSLTAIAEVVHLDTDGQCACGDVSAGLRFTDVDEDDWKALHGLILSKLREEPEGSDT